MSLSSSKPTAASATAGIITYPAEMFRLSFTHSALAKWNFEHIQHQEEGTQIESLSKETRKSMLEESESLFFRDGIQKNSESMFTKYGISKQKLRMLLSPLVRLTSHELAVHSTTHFCERLGLVDQSSNAIYRLRAYVKLFYSALWKYTVQIVSWRKKLGRESYALCGIG
jgi:hypothetical protein